MSFLDHLEELRWHLIRAICSIIFFMVLAFLYMDTLFHYVLLAPTKSNFITYRLFCKLSEYTHIDAFCIKELPFLLQSRQLTGQFSMHITASLVLGLICSFPYIFWEIWRFVKPGLHENEKTTVHGITFYVSSLFFIGILFGYYLVAPLSINFLANYKLDPSIENQFDVISYVSTLCTLVLSGGIIFQLPVISYFLAKMNIISVSLLKKYRKHAIVIIFIIGAIITPPDPFSQTLVSLPLIFLYEVSIFIIKFVEKKKIEEEL